jgi:hypothetical protein
VGVENAPGVKGLDVDSPECRLETILVDMLLDGGGEVFDGRTAGGAGIGRVEEGKEEGEGAEGVNADRDHRCVDCGRGEGANRVGMAGGYFRLFIWGGIARNRW